LGVAGGSVPLLPSGAVTVQLIIASIIQGFALSVPHEIDMEETSGRMGTPLQLHMQLRLPLALYYGISFGPSHG
jgi:hypothetical protein